MIDVIDGPQFAFVDDEGSCEKGGVNATCDQKPALFLEKNIASLGRTPFIQTSVIDIKEKEKANETMSEDKTRDLDQQVLGTFVKSFHRRYERWKRQDLLSVAFQTFPKQVKKEKVTENLTCLKAEFEKKLSGEGSSQEPK